MRDDPRVGVRPILAFAHWAALLLVALGASGFAAEAIGPVVPRPSRDVEPETVIRLPRDPVAAAGVLGRRTNAELVEWMLSPRIEQKEPVYEAISRRRGIDVDLRRKALEALGEVHGRDLAQETFRVMYTTDRGANPDEVLLGELGPVLLSCKREMLEKQYRSLRTLARYSRRQAGREWGWAALATIGPNDRLKTDASGSRERFLLAGIRHVTDAKRRKELLPLLNELLDRATDPDVLAPGFRGLLTCDDSRKSLERVLIHAEKGKAPIAADDAEGILAGRIAYGALAALEEIPAEKIPDALVRRYVTAFVTMQRALQPHERTTSAFRASWEHMAPLVDRLGDDPTSRGLREEFDRLHVPQIVVRAVWQEMRFDPARIELVADRPVEILFENDDDLPQNLVVVKPGSITRVGESADAMTTDEAFDRAFVPQTDDVLHSTELVEPRESASLVFTAPTTPDDYHFVSTVGEDWRNMQGTLRVAESTAAP